jgi:hypothetical protein
VVTWGGRSPHRTGPIRQPCRATPSWRRHNLTRLASLALRSAVPGHDASRRTQPNLAVRTLAPIAQASRRLVSPVDLSPRAAYILKNDYVLPPTETLA